MKNKYKQKIVLFAWGVYNYPLVNFNVKSKSKQFNKFITINILKNNFHLLK
jgi:hypothetical protein